MFAVCCGNLIAGDAGGAEYDVIVIGAGMGGLSAGVHCAANGLKVLVCEQHHKVGGCTSSFSRGDFNFDASLHQMVGVDELLEMAGVRDRIELIRVPEMYRSIFPGVDFTCPGEIGESRDMLIREWPEEEDGIVKYYELMEKVATQALELRGLDGMNPIRKAFTMLLVPLRQRELFKYHKATVQEVMDDCFSDEGLKAVLSQLWVYYGPPPSRLWAPFFLSANYHYFTRGGWQVKGSSQALSDAYAERIEELGGTVKTGCLVTSIILENGRARGVTTDPGDTFTSRYVVSNADPFQTFFTLVGEEHIPRKLGEKIRSLKPGNSILGVYLGLDVTPAHWNIENYEVFYSATLDADEACENMMKGQYEKGTVAMSFYTNLNDPWYAPAGKSVLALHTFSRADFWPKDPTRYQQKKGEIAERLIDLIENILPGVRDHIVVMEVITPLTLQAFTLQKDGIPYGWDLTPDQALKFPAYKTPIDGLYLAGSWTQSYHGVSAAQESGYITAQLILEEEGISGSAAKGMPDADTVTQSATKEVGKKKVNGKGEEGWEEQYKVSKPVIDAYTSVTPRYLPVEFSSHDMHIEQLTYRCRICHHELSSDSKKPPSQPQSCADCHDIKNAPVDLASAMHSACRGCHIETRKKDGESTAPVECLDCHRERE
jgi:prolycopene isomerase